MTDLPTVWRNADPRAFLISRKRVNLVVSDGGGVALAFVDDEGQVHFGAVLQGLRVVREHDKWPETFWWIDLPKVRLV